MTRQNGPTSSLAEDNKSGMLVSRGSEISEGRKEARMEREKQMFGKHICRDNGKERGILADFSRFLPGDTLSSYYSLLW